MPGTRWGIRLAVVVGALALSTGSRSVHASGCHVPQRPALGSSLEAIASSVERAGAALPTPLDPIRFERRPCGDETPSAPAVVATSPPVDPTLAHPPMAARPPAPTGWSVPESSPPPHPLASAPRARPPRPASLGA